MYKQRSHPQERYRPVVRRDLVDIPQLRDLGSEVLHQMLAVSAVLPFRTNTYVTNHLIDWKDIPDDPMFQLTFPQPDMLEADELACMLELVRADASKAELGAAARVIRNRMNPHPSGQVQYNVPVLDGEPVPGVQHKYRDTVLCFPSPGQTCHAYCTYCFRWAQFVETDAAKFSSREIERFLEYVRRNHEIRDVLITGGDPMVMKTKHLRSVIEPLLGPGFEHIREIRLGTKALAYWPQRFVSDQDADDLLRLLGEVRDAGVLPAIMAHYSHPVELSTRVAREAVRRIQDAGGVIRTQAPLVASVNDSSSTWAEMWSEQTALGMVPYYMFVERDTGPQAYFEVPLARALRIYQRAYRSISGLARTVRGPVMSATPGKVQVLGKTEMSGEKAFSLTMLRARNPEWERIPFFAHYDEEATWVDQLVPFGGESAFFFEEEQERLLGVQWRRGRSKHRHIKNIRLR
jgi:KamA family protein